MAAGTKGKLRLLSAEMHNHDFLWFSSFEISKTSTTAPILHNYALTYAVNGFSHGTYSGCVPRYKEDLALMSSYATPALPRTQPKSTRFTQNAINSFTLRTDDAPGGRNSPALGWRVVLDPTWRGKDSLTGFQFYLFADEDFVPPSVVRLGKKGCPIRISWSEIDTGEPVFCKSPVIPSHAVNPLDVTGKIVSCSPVPIPPHLVFRQAEIQDDWFLFKDGHRVHVPARLIERVTNA
ncbi:MAG: type I-D CRISPR-associated protein Cas5/Csc1 [Candidatus Obscuribacterales bacterium]|nr:type I-D CRISPR-associated protein Cas5/Csc1 [Candidatus Obscuribacterales bacterium]